MSDSYIYQEDIITESYIWTVPEAKDQAFEVTIYGGGGSGSIENFDGKVSGAGGGSGFVTTANLTLEAEEEIEIIIADGGKGATGITATAIDGLTVGRTGGTTFFGKYLFAAGGLGGFAGIGGDGYHDGGDSGEDGEGGVGSYGCNSQLTEDVSYSSGGGGSGPNAIGRGGSANYAAGDAGAASGGSGAMVLDITEEGIKRHIGSGGPGVCIIKYHKKFKGV